MAPGSGVTRAKRIVAECESLIEKGVGVNNGLPDLHLKGAILGELLTV